MTTDEKLAAALRQCERWCTCDTMIGFICGLHACLRDYGDLREKAGYERGMRDRRPASLDKALNSDDGGVPTVSTSAGKLEALEALGWLAAGLTVLIDSHNPNQLPQREVVIRFLRQGEEAIARLEAAARLAGRRGQMQWVMDIVLAIDQPPELVRELDAERDRLRVLEAMKPGIVTEIDKTDLDGVTAGLAALTEGRTRSIVEIRAELKVEEDDA